MGRVPPEIEVGWLAARTTNSTKKNVEIAQTTRVQQPKWLGFSFALILIITA